MKRIDDLYWPDHDIDCHKVIVGQSKDIETVLNYVERFSICVQAGGNVGLWPKILSNHFGWVYTFEPARDNWECLQENINEDNIIAYHAGLSDKIEGIEVKSPNKEHDHNCGAYQVFPGDLKTMRIDDLELPDCDLIYLDIEGYELKALQGGVETIDRFRPVITFEDKPLPKMYGKKVGDVEKYLEDFGYRVAQRIHRDVICTPY